MQPLHTADLRAWRARKQGLDGSLDRLSPAAVLAAAGWARSVGGSAPYLSLFARARLRREQADQAAQRMEICELPSVRGCTYVVPAEHFALALSLGAPFSGRERQTAKKLGVTDKELDRLSQKVLDALSGGALEPEQIKEAAGPAVRHLGEEGKKKGMITTLPVALGELQAAGRIRRIPAGGRFDTQRYAYALWDPSPLPNGPLPVEEALPELARLYWRWIGPASEAEFQEFCGLPLKHVRPALEQAGIGPLPQHPGLLIARDEIDALVSFRPGKKPCWRLAASLDSSVLLRRNPRDLLDDPDSAGLKGTGLGDLPHHAILDRGTLTGYWEFDPGAARIVWRTFAKADKALAEEIRRTQEFIVNDLGDCRAYSMDTPKSRAARIVALQAAG